MSTAVRNRTAGRHALTLDELISASYRPSWSDGITVTHDAMLGEHVAVVRYDFRPASFHYARTARDAVIDAYDAATRPPFYTTTSGRHNARQKVAA